MRNLVQTLGLRMAVIAVLAAAHAPRMVAQESSQIRREGDNWVQEVHGSLPARRALKLHSAIGSVQIEGGTGNTVTYSVRKHVFRASEGEARRWLNGFRITAQQKDDVIYISGDFDEGHVRNMGAEFVVNIPRSTDWVRVDTKGGTINVRNLTGRAQVETYGGGISLDDVGGDAQAKTMGGTIHVNDIGGDASLETAGGSIDIGLVNGTIQAQTSGGSVAVGDARRSATVATEGGSIDVHRCTGNLKATTAGGGIVVGDLGAGAVLESAGGGIRLDSAKGAVRATTAGGGIRLMQLSRGVQAETMGGPIEAEFIATPDTESHLSTVAGDITVYLPSNAAVTIKAAIELANGHRIISDFPGLRITSEGGDWGPKEIDGEGAINGGGAVMKIHTANGNITLRKR